ncbi:MAG: Rab family GTPase, partial [Candidatus Hodarchaeota archaeon]
WDIAGQESFSHLRPNFYRGSRAGIIVFSHEENEHGEKSYRNIPKWLADIKKYCGKIPIVIFGNKIDLIEDANLLLNEDHPKSDKNINALLKDYNYLGYFKTSALTGQGVTLAFQTLTRKLFDIYKDFL